MEAIIMIGVIGNFILQTIWFLRDSPKHKLNKITKREAQIADQEEIDLVDRISQFYEDKYENEKAKRDRNLEWDSWMTSTNFPYDFTPRPETEVETEVETIAEKYRAGFDRKCNIKGMTDPKSKAEAISTKTSVNWEYKLNPTEGNYQGNSQDRNDVKKYNPDEIPGMFDDLFVAKESHVKN